MTSRYFRVCYHGGEMVHAVEEGPRCRGRARPAAPQASGRGTRWNPEWLSTQRRMVSSIDSFSLRGGSASGESEAWHQPAKHLPHFHLSIIICVLQRHMLRLAHACMHGGIITATSSFPTMPCIHGSLPLSVLHESVHDSLHQLCQSLCVSPVEALPACPLPLL